MVISTGVSQPFFNDFIGRIPISTLDFDLPSYWPLVLARLRNNHL